MNKWFLVKAKFTKQLDDGTFKRVTEQHLFAAMTWEDAEKRTYEELGAVVRGEFQITGITPQDIHDIFHYEDSDTWYKCVIKFDSDPEADTGKSKPVKQTLLVSAHSVKDAYERIRESLHGMMIDFTIPNVSVSKIVEVWPYSDHPKIGPATDEPRTEVSSLDEEE